MQCNQIRVMNKKSRPILDRSGFSLIELVMTVLIVLALSSLALPATEIAQTRLREKALRQRLTEMRQAIDRYVAARADDGDSRFPPSIASLTEKIPTAMLRPEADDGPFLIKESWGNPFTPRQDLFLWDIRDTDGTWHKNQSNAAVQISCYDVRFPEDGFSGWKKAIDESFYSQW